MVKIINKIVNFILTSLTIISYSLGMVYGTIKPIILKYIIRNFKRGRNLGIDNINKFLKK